jgi:hypothetical protein
MDPRAVADAVETGEEDIITEALRSYNREVSGTVAEGHACVEGQRCVCAVGPEWACARGGPESLRVSVVETVSELGEHGGGT